MTDQINASSAIPFSETRSYLRLEGLRYTDFNQFKNCEIKFLMKQYLQEVEGADLLDLFDVEKLKSACLRAFENEGLHKLTTLPASIIDAVGKAVVINLQDMFYEELPSEETRKEYLHDHDEERLSS